MQRRRLRKKLSRKSGIWFNGVYDYLLGLKEEGIVHHIGLSSHTPSVIQRIIDDVDVDMLLFSVNPAYDYGQGEYANGSVDERSAVYRRCEKEDVGISVMKPFSGGQLLDAKQSPYGKALTPYQCIRYCLDKPGVLTVLPGAQSVEEVETLLRYYSLTEEETDYSVIASFAPPQASGKCVYCNHCKPCPSGIDIGLVNKYYDLALKYMPKGTCGVISFGVKGGRKAAEAFMKELKIAMIATHVADAHTCVLHPASSTHRQMTDEELVAAGVGPDLIRLSVGIENVDDIIEDVAQALDAIK